MNVWVHMYRSTVYVYVQSSERMGKHLLLRNLNFEKRSACQCRNKVKYG